MATIRVVANGKHGIHLVQPVHGLVTIFAARIRLDHESVHAQGVQLLVNGSRKALLLPPVEARGHEQVLRGDYGGLLGRLCGD